MIQDELQTRVDSNNFNLSTINKTGLYSVEPNKNCPESDWHLCLIDTDNEIINYFIIPKESNIYSKLYVRKDRNTFRLIFEPTDKLFKEKLSNNNESFKEYLIKSFPCKDLW